MVRCGRVLSFYLLPLSSCCFAAVLVVSVVGGGVLVPADGSFCFSFHVQDPSSQDEDGKGTQREDLINM